MHEKLTRDVMLLLLFECSQPQAKLKKNAIFGKIVPCLNKV